jgi:replication-associated recombination protein RarA
MMANTPNGYDLHELLSALQKCIRRGLEYEAVHFAAELKGFNHTAMWNRLKIIASEDVGCANPIAPLLIDTLFKEYQTAKGKLGDDSFRLFMVNAVICLCHSPKSRVTDDLLTVVYTERELEGKRLKIPDFALEMHTKRGAAMGRGIDYFFTEGNKLEKEAFPNPYSERAKDLLKKHRKPA